MIKRLADEGLRSCCDPSGEVTPPIVVTARGNWATTRILFVTIVSKQPQARLAHGLSKST